MQPPSEDICDMILADSSLNLAFGTSLFMAKEPASPDNVVTVFDTPGLPPALTLGNDVGYYYPSIQIRVRNRNYLIGFDLISSIARLLHGRGPELWNNVWYTSIICVGDPAFLDWDENERVRFFVNFNLQRRSA